MSPKELSCLVFWHCLEVKRDPNWKWHWNETKREHEANIENETTIANETNIENVTNVANEAKIKDA